MNRHFRSPFAAVALSFGMVGAAKAALTQAELARAVVQPEPGVQLPLGTPLVDTNGQSRTLGERLAGRPALLVLADTRCTQLCGPILSIVGRALGDTGLAAGRDYDLLVVNFNPAATVADGVAMRDAQLGRGEIAAVAQMVRSAPEGLATIENSLGYTAVHDDETGRFAHPTDVFVVTADGRLSRELGGLSLDGATVRLALVEAGQGQIGTMADRLHLLCYGLDPSTGRYTNGVLLTLRLGAGATVAALAAAVVLFMRRPAGGGGRA